MYPVSPNLDEKLPPVRCDILAPIFVLLFDKTSPDIFHPGCHVFQDSSQFGKSGSIAGIFPKLWISKCHQRLN